MSRRPQRVGAVKGLHIRGVKCHGKVRQPLMDPTCPEPGRMFEANIIAEPGAVSGSTPGAGPPEVGEVSHAPEARCRI